MDISPDGTTVVSAAADETLRFWRCFPERGKKKTTNPAPASLLLSTIR